MTVACATTQSVNPDASDKHYQLGENYFAQRMYRPALEELMKALELNPENADAHYLLGLLALQQASEQEEMFERQSCVSGDEAKLERRELDERFNKAEQEFRKAVTLRPDS